MSGSNNLSPVRRALVSVSDKTHLDQLAGILSEYKVEILSTGGTYKALVEFGAAAVPVSEFTGAPEMLDGRVKTLHPKIHGGILALPTEAHENELRLHGLAPIDLVIVNLYPFRETIAKPGVEFAEAIENIDIGGPTMLRSAAKNWNRVAVIVDPSDYASLGEVLAENDGMLPDAFRRAMSRKAFAHTAGYDAAIATYLDGFDDAGEERDEQLSEEFFFAGRTTWPLRYGENPHQEAGFYSWQSRKESVPGLDQAKQHQGKALSYNNLLDADAALALIRDLAPLGTSAAVFKHVSPCGAALGQDGESLKDVFIRAREADAESAFGGIVALSGEVDEELAESLAETFLEVIVAPGYTDGALERLSKKKNLRLLEVDLQIEKAATCQPTLRLRSVAGGVLVQAEDRIGVAVKDGKVAGKVQPSEAILRDLEFANVIGKHVRSNAIVLVVDGVTVGIGGGQTSRVEAMRQAVRRAGERAKGAVIASDAFFPFRDSIDHAAELGIRGIVQPGGSVRDEEVIAAADEHEIPMVFTGERHFRH